MDKPLAFKVAFFKAQNNWAFKKFMLVLTTSESAYCTKTTGFIYVLEQNIIENGINIEQFFG